MIKVKGVRSIAEAPIVTPSERRREVTFTAALEDTPQHIFLRSDRAVLSRSPESYIAATLLPAMQAGVDLTAPGALDSTFASNLETIQDVYANWYPELQRVAFGPDGGEMEPKSKKASKTGTFFTGGIDSFYTLLKHEEQIDALVYVHGFDAQLDDEVLRSRISDMLQVVGDHFGKEVIEMETNLRHFSDARAGWPRYHGAALAFAGLALQRELDRLFIPSSLSYRNLKPWGSSPLLDPLWSTSTLQFVHDGCEASRLDKCRAVGKSDLAMQALHVCWKNPDGTYNCGRCEKCMRTMVQLLAADALPRCTAFEQDLDVKLLADVEAVHTRSYRYKESLTVLKEKGDRPDVIAALEAALAGPSIWQRGQARAYEAYRAGRHQAGHLLRSWGLR